MPWLWLLLQLLLPLMLWLLRLLCCVGVGWVCCVAVGWGVCGSTGGAFDTQITLFAISIVYARNGTGLAWVYRLILVLTI